METVEVFKTNVSDAQQASHLLGQIHQAFPAYKATFDLDDCDRILRVASQAGVISSFMLIDFLKSLGCEAQVLPDELLPAGDSPFPLLSLFY
ncbi:MAG: hypothetical protein ACO1O1_13795 [Adhaeribacter sp.]